MSLSTPPPEPSGYPMAHHLLAQPDQPLSQRQAALLELMQTNEAVAYTPLLVAIAMQPTEPLALRCACVLSLGRIATPDALAALAILRHHPDAPLRQYALEALVTTQQPDVLPWLIEALADEDNAVFGVAAQGLGQFSTQAVPLLCGLLSDTAAAADARCVAAWQLGEVAGHEAVPALITQLQTPNPTDVLALCLWALGEIGHHSPEVLAVLQWGKQQANPEIRLRAETALKKVVRAFN